MDVKSFLERGVEIPNPAYNKNSKKGKLQLPTINSYNPDHDVDNSFFESAGRLAVEQTHKYELPRSIETYKKMGITPTKHDTFDELEAKLAENQSWTEQAWNAHNQAVYNEIALGTVKGFADIADYLINGGSELAKKMGVNTDGWDNDYTNPVSGQLEEWQNNLRDYWEIYRRDPNAAWDITDSGWWFGHSVSIASTLSLLIPSTGVAKLSKVSKLTKLGKLAGGFSKLLPITSKIDKASDAANIINKMKLARAARWAKKGEQAVEIGIAGLSSRIAESYIESRDVYKHMYDESLARLQTMDNEERENLYYLNPQLKGKSDEEIAKFLAGESADETFNRDMVLAIADMYQFKALKNLYKITGKAAGNVTLDNAVRSAGQQLVGATPANPTLFSKIGKAVVANSRRLGLIGKEQISEGFEEYYQYAAQEQGKDKGRSLIDANTSIRSITDFITDGHALESAFWGWLGGIVFQGAGSKAKKAWNKFVTKRADINTENRKADINSWIAKAAAFRGNLQAIENGQNPFATGSDNATLEDDIDKNRARQTAEDNFIVDTVLNAAQNGNLDYLQAFISTPEFGQYFDTQGSQNSNQGKSISEEIKSRIEQVSDIYEGNLEHLYTMGVSNPGIAQAIARENTLLNLALLRSEENLTDFRNALNQEIETISKIAPNDANYIRENLSAVESYIHQLVYDKRIEVLDNRIAELEKKLATTPNRANEINEEIKELNNRKDYIKTHYGGKFYTSSDIDTNAALDAYNFINNKYGNIIEQSANAIVQEFISNDYRYETSYAERDLDKRVTAVELIFKAQADEATKAAYEKIEAAVKKHGADAVRRAIAANDNLDGVADAAKAINLLDYTNPDQEVIDKAIDAFIDGVEENQAFEVDGVETTEAPQIDQIDDNETDDSNDAEGKSPVGEDVEVQEVALNTPEPVEDIPHTPKQEAADVIAAQYEEENFPAIPPEQELVLAQTDESYREINERESKVDDIIGLYYLMTRKTGVMSESAQADYEFLSAKYKEKYGELVPGSYEDTYLRGRIERGRAYASKYVKQDDSLKSAIQDLFSEVDGSLTSEDNLNYFMTVLNNIKSENKSFLNLNGITYYSAQSIIKALNEIGLSHAEIAMIYNALAKNKKYKNFSKKNTITEKEVIEIIDELNNPAKHTHENNVGVNSDFNSLFDKSREASPSIHFERIRNLKAFEALRPDDSLTLRVVTKNGIPTGIQFIAPNGEVIGYNDVLQRVNITLDGRVKGFRTYAGRGKYSYEVYETDGKVKSTIDTLFNILNDVQNSDVAAELFVLMNNPSDIMEATIAEFEKKLENSKHKDDYYKFIESFTKNKINNVSDRANALKTFAEQFYSFVTKSSNENGNLFEEKNNSFQTFIEKQFADQKRTEEHIALLQAGQTVKARVRDISYGSLLVGALEKPIPIDEAIVGYRKSDHKLAVVRDNTVTSLDGQVSFRFENSTKKGFVIIFPNSTKSKQYIDVAQAPFAKTNKLFKPVFNYYYDLIESFLNAENKEKSFEENKENFLSFIGRDKLIDGFKVYKNADTIVFKDDKGNELVVFGTNADKTKGVGLIIKTPNGSVSIKKVTKENKQKLKTVLADFLSAGTFALSLNAVNKKSDIFKQEDGVLKLTIGNKVYKYKDYTDFVIKNKAGLINLGKADFTGERNGNTINHTTNYGRTYGTAGSRSTRSIKVEYNIMNNDYRKAFIDDVLKRINKGQSHSINFETYVDIFTPSYTGVYNSLNKLDFFKDLTLRINKKDKSNAFGKYKNGRITIFERGLQLRTDRTNKQNNEDYAFRVLLHEGLHAYLQRQGIAKNVAAEIKDLYNNHISKILDGDISEEVLEKILEESSAFSNAKSIDDVKAALSAFKSHFNNLNKKENSDEFVEEFIIEALTSPTFRAFLNNITYENNSKKSVWDKILEIISTIFGVDVNENSALAYILDISNVHRLANENTTPQVNADFNEVDELSELDELDELNDILDNLDNNEQQETQSDETTEWLDDLLDDISDGFNSVISDHVSNDEITYSALSEFTKELSYEDKQRFNKLVEDGHIRLICK